MCSVGVRRDEFLAKLFIGGPALRNRKQRGQPVIVIMLTRFELQKKFDICCCLCPPSLAAFEVKPRNQKIQTRRLADKCRRQSFTKEPFCFAKLSLGH